MHWNEKLTYEAFENTKRFSASMVVFFNALLICADFEKHSKALKVVKSCKSL